MTEEQIPARRGKKPAVIAEDVVARVVDYHSQGFPMKYIAMLTGLSTYHVKRVLCEQGLYVNKCSARVNNSLKE